VTAGGKRKRKRKKSRKGTDQGLDSSVFPSSTRKRKALKPQKKNRVRVATEDRIAVVGEGRELRESSNAHRRIRTQKAEKKESARIGRKKRENESEQPWKEVWFGYDLDGDLFKTSPQLLAQSSRF